MSVSEARQLCNAFYLFTKANTHLPRRARVNVRAVPFFRLRPAGKEIPPRETPSPAVLPVISFRRHFTLGRGRLARRLTTLAAFLNFEERNGAPFGGVSVNGASEIGACHPPPRGPFQTPGAPFRNAGIFNFRGLPRRSGVHSLSPCRPFSRVRSPTRLVRLFTTALCLLNFFLPAKVAGRRWYTRDRNETLAAGVIGG